MLAAKAICKEHYEQFGCAGMAMGNAESLAQSAIAVGKATDRQLGSESIFRGSFAERKPRKENRL